MRYVALRDSTSIDIPIAASTEAPIAFKWKDWTGWNDNGERLPNTTFVRRWYNKQLWQPYEYSIVGRPAIHVSMTELQKELKYNGRKYSLFEFRAHDLNFLKLPSECPSKKEWFDANPRINPNTLRYLGSNRDLVIQTICQEQVIVINGKLWVPGDEPRYVIKTFGLGNNHASTAMSVETFYNSNISNNCYFRADQYALARKIADKIAIGRGDTNSLPVKPDSEIKVLYKKAIKLQPQKDHGSGCEFINAIESGIEAGGPVGGMLAITKLLCVTK